VIPFKSSALLFEFIQRTGYAEATLLEDVRIDHGRRQNPMAEQSLDRPNIRSALQ